MRRIAYVISALFALGFAIPSTSRAEFMNGHVLTLQNLFHGAPSPGYTTTFTVDSTPGAIEVPAWGTFRTLSIDVYDTGPSSASILITNLSTVTYGSSPNLTDLTDTNSDIAPFLGVTIGSTNIVGMDASRLAFTADTIDLDFGGLTVAQGQSVRIDITTNAVPEPASLMMVGTGAIAILGYARRRRAAA